MLKSNHEPARIEDYGLIGNLKTVALVSMYGSIDFMCYPSFDSPTVFAKLLDQKIGGSFTVSPQMDGHNTKQLYLPATAVLLTRFFSEEGIAELTDYMPVDGRSMDKSNAIVRQVKTVRGNITFQVTCQPSFDYAASVHTCEMRDDAIYFHAENEDRTVLRLLADVPLQIKGNTGYAEFTLEQGQTAYLVLECGKNQVGDKNPIEVYKHDTYDETIRFWRDWSKKSTYKGRWNSKVNRSAITLKLLTSHELGSMVAAPTFSLPEVIGGNRNWDYRYMWIRDAAFTMYAFLKLGYTEEASAFLKWIHDRCQDDKLYLMYTIAGQHDLDEKELSHLTGYQNSLPVRIGNAAQDQSQIDIYGELIDTIYIFNKHSAITFEFWETIVKQVKEVIEKWQTADHGIWEIRNTEQHFLHSRLMCWVAMDRAIKIGQHRSFPFPENEWKAVRDDIYNEIYHQFWNEEIGAWVQYKGAETVDASVLLMSLMHFISPFEPRWLSTLKVVEEQLGVDVLLYRYKNGEHNFDGLSGEEGTFNMCSFWYIESLAKSGQVSKALESFEKMTGYANHLGLFSEQIGHKAEHLGNFPQAFTHLALISAALEIDKQLDRI